jgi:exopolysaccharide biosynthesis protein
MKGDSLAVSLGARRQRRRALIGIDREQRLIIAVTDSLFGGLSWVELQELFGAAQWRLQARDLLNLDGGGSAQLYLRAGQFEEYVAGATEVPVVIGFFPRTN